MSHPAELTGGDYFDYFPLLGGGVGVAIGDVCGHGFGPALLMAATRAYLRALALTNARVGDILSLANRALAADVDDGRFVTLFLARLDPAARTLVYANAGPPIRLRPGARRRRSVRSSEAPACRWASPTKPISPRPRPSRSSPATTSCC